jgi:hypothetical protein
MGFYDYRCMLTGVSLQPERAVLVPLYESDGALAPIAFGIKGSYNRLGAIDRIEEDANTNAILEFFLGKLATREYVVDEEYLRGERAFPITNIEQLVSGFERNVTDHPRAALLHGLAVKYGLISRSVWQGVVDAALPLPSDTNVLHKLFADSAIAARIYRNGVDRLMTHANELSAIMDLMRGRHLVWTAPSDPDQWYDREMLQFLNAARAAFSDCPPVLAGLNAYERALND